jgi:hypothetical protein
MVTDSRFLTGALIAVICIAAAMDSWRLGRRQQAAAIFAGALFFGAVVAIDWIARNH